MTITSSGLAVRILEFVREERPTPDRLEQWLMDQKLSEQDLDDAMWQLAKRGQVTLNNESRVVLTENAVSATA